MYSFTSHVTSSMVVCSQPAQTQCWTGDLEAFAITGKDRVAKVFWPEYINSDSSLYVNERHYLDVVEVSTGWSSRQAASTAMRCAQTEVQQGRKQVMVV